MSIGLTIDMGSMVVIGDIDKSFARKIGMKAWLESNQQEERESEGCKYRQLLILWLAMTSLLRTPVPSRDAE